MSKSEHYPPAAYLTESAEYGVELTRQFPFAHFVTNHSGLRVSKVPAVVDVIDGKPARLRGHLDARNPQARGLDGEEVVVDFSGASAYVSPFWRAEKNRGGTIDYEEVQVRGRARVAGELDFFRQLIDDLSSIYEPAFAGVGDYPIWSSREFPMGYFERQFPMVVCFEVAIEEFLVISKLHQGWSREDRESVADHLERCRREQPSMIADRIRERLEAE